MGGGNYRNPVHDSDGADSHRYKRRKSRKSAKYRGPDHGMVGDSPAFRQALFLLRRFKKTNLPLLIQGETGTGKDLAARYVHRWGPRKAGQFTEVSSGNLPTELAESELFGHKRGAFTGATSDRKGAFEVAHGGTLLLNEIGDMPLEIQVKLLRAIQNGVIQRLGETRDIHVDVRVIAATWRDLPAMVANGEFRGDLYHRLAVGQVELPSLEARGHDAILIARGLLATAPEKHGLPRRSLSREAADVLLAYPWPGNVRELQHVLLRALATGSGRSLSDSDVLRAIKQIAGEWGMESESEETRSPLEILERASPMTAADLRAALGVSRSTLSRLLRPLIESRQILREGTGVATRYRLAGSVEAAPMSDPRWSIAVDLAIERGCVTRRELAAALGVSERTSTRVLRAMVEAGVLCERGHGRGVEYVLVAEENERAPR